MLRALLVVLALFAGMLPSAFASTPERVPLAVTINGQAKPDVFGWLSEEGLWLAVSDIAGWGIKAEADATHGGKKAVSLKSLNNKVRFDEAEMRITVTLNSAELDHQTKINLLKPPLRGEDITVAPGLLVDYEVGAGRFGSGTSVDTTVRTRASLGGLQLLDDRSATVYNGVARVAPWRTTLRKDWLSNNLRLDLGTLTTPDGGLGYWAAWRGISLSSAYYGFNSLQAARPSTSLVTNVLFPSTADIYVNGVKQASYAVAPGSFDVRGLRGYAAGATTVKAVIRDIFGNESVVEESRYLGDGALAVGVQEFNYQLGRSEYARDGALGFRGAHRYGVGQFLTLTGRLEVQAGQRVAQVGGVVPVTGWGEVGASVLIGRAGGREPLRGYSLTHDYRAKSWSVNTTLTSRPVPVREDIAHSAENLKQLSSQGTYATAALGQYNARVSVLQYPDGRVGRELELGWSKNLRENLFVQVAVRKSDTAGASAQVLFVWRPQTGYAVNSYSDGSRGHFNQQVSLSRQPGQGPTAWRAEARSQDGRESASGHVEHRLAAGTAKASVYSDATSQSGRVAWRGGLLASPLGISNSPSHSDSAVVVDTAGIAGVGVFRNGSQVGVTDEAGRLWVTDVTGYEEVRLTLNENDIPMDRWYAGGAVRAIRPAPGGVVPVAFDIRSIRTADVEVQDCTQACRALPDQRVLFESEGGVLVTTKVILGKGKLEGLLTGSHEVHTGDGSCTGDLFVAKTGPVLVKLKCSPGAESK